MWAMDVGSYRVVDINKLHNMFICDEVMTRCGWDHVFACYNLLQLKLLSLFIRLDELMPTLQQLCKMSKYPKSQCRWQLSVGPWAKENVLAAEFPLLKWLHQACLFPPSSEQRAMGSFHVCSCHETGAGCPFIPHWDDWVRLVLGVSWVWSSAGIQIKPRRCTRNTFLPSIIHQKITL